MDIFVLPNNDHPEKFLQLDVKMLGATFQAGALRRHWQNRLYSQVQTMLPSLICARTEQMFKSDTRSHPSLEGSPAVFMDRYLEKHITPITLNSNIKRNPLYMDIKLIDTVDSEKFKPSWTIKDYDTQTIHSNLADHLKKTPKDLDFWLEDLYTPGFDSLLKRKQAEHQKKILCKILSTIILLVCAVLLIVVVPVVLLQKKN
ncbi:major intrinsically disordered NOTCH2-binding receptor 1-like [Odontesthes bonariensis]|uniref:major intrinsically disordered NOTCH2-binding receptor 1-like n=1 Tax=Odontesthes bonariensis TaxID=219752 RepID=UPI003F581A14